MYKANKSAKGSIEIQYEAYDKHGINGLIMTPEKQDKTLELSKH